MIPITLVTGFLGSGKTSLLAHLLDNTEGRRIAVIINDMAPRCIDGVYLRGGEFLLTEDDETIRTISGGRVGAGKREALVEQVQELARSEPAPEAILVETSGGSPALSVADALENDPALKDLVTVDSIITMVDTAAFPGIWSDSLLKPVLVDQISAADLVVLNKFDRAGFLARVRSRLVIKSVRPGVPVIAAEFGRLDPVDILHTDRRASAPPHLKKNRSNPNHYPLVARQLEETRPFHPERLHEWLSRDWPGIVRVKGFLWLATDMEHVYVVDSADDQRELGMEGTWYGALPEDQLPDDPRIRELLAEHPYQDRRQSITIIGEPEAVERELRGLRAALLSVTELDRGPGAWASITDPITQAFRD